MDSKIHKLNIWQVQTGLKKWDRTDIFYTFYLVNTDKCKLKQSLQWLISIIQDLHREGVIIIPTASSSISLIWSVFQPGRNEWDFTMDYLSLHAMVWLITVPIINIMEIIDSIQLAIRDVYLWYCQETATNPLRTYIKTSPTFFRPFWVLEATYSSLTNFTLAIYAVTCK